MEKSKATIEIKANFGREFQRNQSTDSLLMILRIWKKFNQDTHQKNELEVFVNGDEINNLDWFNWSDDESKE